MITISPRPSPLSLVALLLVGGGLVGLLRDRERLPVGAEATGCASQGPSCAPGGAQASPFTDSAPTPTLVASDVCIDVGYLCAELASHEVIRLLRWTDFEGTLVVHVPMPDGEDPAAARSLQRAAAQGVRAWSGQPFPILADLRGDRNPHFAIRWSRSLGGSQLGVTQTQWSAASGLSVVSIGLVTRSPFNPSQAADPRQVRLTAAHEMGHALGLDHSDSRRDIMYPTNTATSMSAQDYRTIEVLYSMDDGTQIRR